MMTRTLVIEESVPIRRAPEAVWAMVTDYESDHLWRPGITEMTPDPPGPTAVGTRVRECRTRAVVPT
jgi:Polyketide cyclase / dehydrase and lipid transport